MSVIGIGVWLTGCSGKQNPGVTPEIWQVLSQLQFQTPVTGGSTGVVDNIPVRWIPPGEFLMGSTEADEWRDSDEAQHAVTLSRGFLMSATECNQEQWSRIMDRNRSAFESGDRPVENVSWHEAHEFCQRLTEKHHTDGTLPLDWSWRLPTEAEWEYAARAGNPDVRYGELDLIAWHADNSKDGTRPVGQKDPNAWGLHDMIGNVWEWCGDWFDGGYATNAVTDPTGPASGADRIYRGGGWLHDYRSCRVSDRVSYSPTFRGNDLGFRLVLCPPNTP
jgi:formylglycine-generating enzyme required for sulfatase activity